MAARIESVATAVSSRIARKNARRLADEAARICLERAGVRPHELELLVNVGIYREDNLVEPALASMIQEDIGANPGHPPVEGAHGTFSFDVNDGGRGVVTAFELLDGFVASATAATVMVVASDVIPPMTSEAGVSFPPVGGAVLLRPDEKHAGFVDFHSECVEPGEARFDSWVDWHEHVHRLRLLGDGENLLEFEVGKEFSLRAVQATQNAAKTFLQRHELRPSDVDLVIPSQYPARFPTEIGRALEIAPERVVRVGPALSGAHTAGPIGALERAFMDGRFRQARTILFAAVGGGISVGLALYRH